MTCSWVSDSEEADSSASEWENCAKLKNIAPEDADRKIKCLCNGGYCACYQKEKGEESWKPSSCMKDPHYEEEPVKPKPAENKPDDYYMKFGCKADGNCVCYLKSKGDKKWKRYFTKDPVSFMKQEGIPSEPWF